MTTPAFGYPPCPGDFVQLEMVGEVPEIGAGERFTWSSSGKQRFIYRKFPSVRLDEDGEFVYSEDPYKVIAYMAAPGFDMSPYMAQFHQPEQDAVCLLESVRNRNIEQLAQSGYSGFEIFRICQNEPLHVAWPTFNQEHPLLIGFHNPFERDLLPFYISLHLSVPKDFAERWIDEEKSSKA